MNFVDYTRGEIGLLKIYNTNSSEGVLDNIAFTEIVKVDESGVVVKDSIGNTIIVSGFPVIVKYNDEIPD